MSFRISALRPSFLVSVLAAMAAVVLLAATPAKATPMTFDISQPLTVTSLSGFTGIFNDPQTFDQVNIRFNFLTGNPVPFVNSAFTITNITLSGDGITTPLTFPNVSIPINADGSAYGPASALVLQAPPTDVNFANSLISFSIPANVISSIGSEFGVNLRYFSAGEGTTRNSSVIEFQAVPEPHTMALLGTSGAAIAAGLIRRRRIMAKV